VTAHELMERGAFTADELRARMDQSGSGSTGPDSRHIDASACPGPDRDRVRMI